MSVDFTVIFDSIGSLFMIILTGFIASRKKIITESMNKGLIDLLIQIALPCMILSSFIFTYDDSIKTNVVKTFYLSLAAYGIIIILSYILVIPVKGDKKTILHFANVFVNTGYIGFPILNAVYGSEGVVYGSIFNMFFVVLVWTYGLMLYKGNLQGKELKAEIIKILLNPSILAVCAGILIMLTRASIPAFLLSAVRSVGSMTGPLSMIIIGMILSNVKPRNYLKDWTLYYGTAVKLAIIPGIILGLALWAGDLTKPAHTVIIMSAMPASAMTSIFAEQYDREKEFAAVYVSLTTLLSLVSSVVLLKIIL